MSTTLLSYQFSADPDPVQISTAQSPANGLLNVAASAGGAQVYCNTIAVSVPVGSDATSLYSDTPIAAVNTTKWVITATKQQQGSDLGVATQDVFATFVFECENPVDFLIDYDLAFSVSGPVNQTPGTYPVILTENSGTTSDPSTFTTKSAQFSFDKTEPHLYLQNFVATDPNAPLTPATDFKNGADIQFSWESNAMYFEVFAKDDPAPIYAGSATTFTLKGGVARGTTFVLAASLIGSAATTSTSDFSPVVRYATLAVTIANPVLTPTNVAIGGGAPGNAALGVAGDIRATGHIAGIGICPHGSVIMFYGDISDPTKFNAQGTGVAGTQYEGWQVCNGQKGSPNLLDKFVPAAGGQYEVGDQGGADSIVLTVTQMPGHNHGGGTGGAAPYLNYQGVYYQSQGVTNGIMVNIQTADPNGNRPNALTTKGQPEIQVQSHGHSIGNDGGNAAHENRPQFFALGYLMRL